MTRGAAGAFAGVLLLLFAVGSATSAPPTTHAKSRWRATVAKLPANAAIGDDYWVYTPSISCASPGNCVAVGSYELDSEVKPCGFPGLLLTEKAGHWETGVEAVLPANARSSCPSASLTSVSCPSLGNCVAVGSYESEEGGALGLLLTEKAGHWTAHEAVLPADADPGSDVGLSSVSCASPGNCTAVGAYSDSSGHDSRGLLLIEWGGDWAPGVEAPLPSDASGTGVDLSSVSCAADGSCAAVGYYNGYFGGRDAPSGDPLLLAETGGEWRAAKAVMPPDGPGEAAVVTSVSCASGGNCSAIGLYNINVDSSYGPESVLLTEKAGEWGRGVRARPPTNASSGYWRSYVGVAGISCASPGNCVAVGGYRDDNDHPQGTMVTEKGGGWRRGVEAGLPRRGTGGALTAVSCSSPGNCTAAGYYYGAGPHGGLMFVTETAGTWARGVRAPLSPPIGIFAVSCVSPGNCGAVGGDGLLGSQADAVLFDSSTKPCIVPRLIGKTMAAARRSLDSRGCTVGRIEHTRSQTVEARHVISQTRQPGSRRAPWTRVGLTVSKGP